MGLIENAHPYKLLVAYNIWKNYYDDMKKKEKPGLKKKIK